MGTRPRIGRCGIENRLAGGMTIEMLSQAHKTAELYLGYKIFYAFGNRRCAYEEEKQ